MKEILWRNKRIASNGAPWLYQRRKDDGAGIRD